MLSLKFARVFLALGLFSTIHGQQNTESITIGKQEKYELKETLKPGSVIVIDGTITTPQFDINFTPLLSGDISLHISVRKKLQEIAINSFTNNKWDSEIKTRFPAGYDDTFKIDIVCGHHFYEISMNGKNLAHFPYRHALNKVKFIRNFDFNQKYTITFPKSFPMCSIDKDCIVHLQTDEI